MAAALLAAPALAIADPCPGASVASECALAGEFGNSGEAIMRQPQAIDLLPGGGLLVGDRWGYRVQQFDASHAPAGSFGEYGDGPGQFAAVGGIAHDSAGNRYVLDIEHDRVEKFAADGRFLIQWGGRGSDLAGPAPFDVEFKGGIAVDGARVYVSDTFNQRVAEYGSDGHWIGQIGETGVAGTDSAHLSYPQGVTVDAAHDIYVADDRNDRVQKFDSDGSYLATIGSSAELDSPYDVGVDAAGNVYVANNLGHRVEKYDAAGTHLTGWGGQGEAPGQLQTPRALVVDAAGDSYVADTNNGRVQEFEPDGNLLAAWGLNGRTGGRLTGPMGLDLAAGRLAVADTLEYWVQELDPASGAPITKFGGHGTSPGRFELPGDVALDASGAARVADTANDRLQLFDPANAFVGELGGLSAPAGVAVDSANNVYAADSGNGRVIEYTPAGLPIRALGGLSRPADVAVGPSGDVFVSDAGAGRVLRFDLASRLVGSWPVNAPAGIDVDSAGRVFVADPAGALVHVYDSDGLELLRFGGRGHGPGEFWTGGPQGVTVAGDGTLFASDPYGNRVERFALSLPAPPPAAPPAAAPSSTARKAPTRVKVRVLRRSLGSALRRGVAVRLTCPRRCSLTATLRLGRRSARRLHTAAVVARAHARLPAGRTRTVTLRFSKRARRALAHTRRVTLRLELTVRPASLRAPARTLTLRR